MKVAKVFSNGRSRAVRIPSDWLRGAEEVELRRVGNSVVIEPVLPTLKELSERFRKGPVEVERLPQGKTEPKAL